MVCVKIYKLLFHGIYTYVDKLFNYLRLLTLSTIENVHKKRAHDKESRLATVMVSADLLDLKNLASLNKTFYEKIQRFTKRCKYEQLGSSLQLCMQLLKVANTVNKKKLPNRLIWDLYQESPSLIRAWIIPVFKEITFFEWLLIVFEKRYSKMWDAWLNCLQ